MLSERMVPRLTAPQRRGLEILLACSKAKPCSWTGKKYVSPGRATTRHGDIYQVESKTLSRLVKYGLAEFVGFGSTIGGKCYAITARGRMVLRLVPVVPC